MSERISSARSRNWGRQDAWNAVISALVQALCRAPMSSNPRSTSAAVRCSVPLNIMCSRKWLTPICAGCSSLAPVRTKNPIAVECASGSISAAMRRPLGRTCSRNVTGMGAGMASGGWFGFPFRRASWIDSAVGWACIVEMMSSAVASRRIARQNSWMSSDASLPMMCA